MPIRGCKPPDALDADDTEGFLAKTLAYMESYPPQRIDAMREAHYAKYLSGAALARHSDGEASTRDSIHSEHADTICDADPRPDAEARELAAAERLHQMERVIASARSAACASQRTAEGARGQRRAAEELLEQREAALFAAQAEREAAAEVSRNAPVRNRFTSADNGRPAGENGGRSGGAGCGASRGGSSLLGPPLADDTAREEAQPVRGAAAAPAREAQQPPGACCRA